MLLLDNSAWSRLRSGAVPAPRREQIETGRLAVCLPFLLEAGFSARSAGDHAALMSRFELFPRLEVDAEVEEAALAAQRELAAVGHHRLPPADLTIAACAARAGAGVLHYDRDYDLIAELTSLRFDSVWVAEPGSLR